MDKISDLRPPFFMIEESVVNDYGLTPYEGWLYVVMLKHANRKTGELFPSIQTLVKETQMSKAQVLRCTKTLEEKRLIRVTRDERKNGKDRSVNHYFILAATRYLPDTTPGVSQELPPVSGGNMNKNQFEQEKDSPASADGKKPRPIHKNAPIHDALLECFGLTPTTVTKTGDRTYWTAAADFAKIEFPVDKITPFHRWCKGQEWPSFTVMAMAKYAGEWLSKQPNTPIELGDDGEPVTASYIIGSDDDPFKDEIID